ncbi:MAG: hypothetical protein LBF79_04225 [Dysgonamonadaceae bacterium]|nr:hypothetical protein [Dysgonamonadaceae bacterium]
MRRSSRFWFLLFFWGAILLGNGGCGGSDAPLSEFAGGQGTPENPYQIATAKQLENVRNHLDRNFVLTSDINLASYENWEPIGTLVFANPEEDQETPVMELAFTGVFDGGGHTVSNIIINTPEKSGVGLFGCIAGDIGSISNLVVENVNVKGMTLVGGVIGYRSIGSAVKNIRLVGNDNYIEGGNMVGGILGGGFCDIVDCEAQANVKLVGDEGGLAGVLAGGMETCDIIGSHATGTITVEGANDTGIGGLAGCVWWSQKVLDCSSDVVITVGEDNMMIGGLVGYAGRGVGVDGVTLISGCSVTAVINAPNSAERIGGIVGSGFYSDVYEANYFPGLKPTAISIVNCNTSGQIDGGIISGTIIGYAYNNSFVTNCASDMTIKDGTAKQVGATETDIPLDNLR